MCQITRHPHPWYTGARFYHPNDAIQYKNVGDYQVVTSSATKNSINSSFGGVGFLLSSKASKNLLSVETISPRIMIIELDGNPKVTIICAYSHHNGSPEEEVQTFYSTLQSTMQDIRNTTFSAL